MSGEVREAAASHNDRVTAAYDLGVAMGHKMAYRDVAKRLRAGAMEATRILAAGTSDTERTAAFTTAAVMTSVADICDELAAKVKP